MRYCIPTTNDGVKDFEPLFALQEEVRRQRHIIIDFSECHFLRQNAVAFLGGLARFAESQTGTVTFDWATLRPDVRANLARSGFLSAFGANVAYHRGHAIPYHEDRSEDKTQTTTYLRKQWLGAGWIALSEALRDEIVSKVVEIYDNTFAHAQSPIGMTSCGQHYPRLKLLKLTAVDFGIGIPANVRRYKKKNISAAEAIKWALQPGTTTQRHTAHDIVRGMGLDLLKQFVRTNGGTLEIFSGGGYALIDKSGERFDTASSFDGTVINITLRCDESYYYLQSEEAGTPFF